MTSKRWTSGEILTNEDLNALAVIADATEAEAAALSESVGEAFDRIEAAEADILTAQAAADAAQITASAALPAAGNLATLADSATAIVNLGLGDGGANIAGLQASLGLADVATSGSYDDLSNTPTEASDTAGDGFIFVDAGYTEKGRWSGDGLETRGAFSADTIDLTEGEVELAADGKIHVDAGYTVISIEGPEGIEHDVSVTADNLTAATFTATTTATLLSLEAELGDGDGRVFVDAGYTVTDMATADEPNAAEAPPTHSVAEISARDALNQATAASMATHIISGYALPLWYYSHFIIYGQSLSVGAEGTPELSTDAQEGLYMYGSAVLASNNSPPTTAWTRVGGDAFNALDAVDGEVPIHGALRTFRPLWRKWRSITADTNIRFVASGCGIGGVGTNQLVPGHSPEYYNRVRSVMDQANARATTESKAYGVVAMLFMGGESNMLTTQSDYVGYLRSIITTFRADAITESGQEDPPAFFLYQTVAANTNFDSVNLGAQMGQLEAALNDDGVFMVGPNYPYPDSNNLHLPANSNRWMGAKFGQVMHRVLCLGHRWKPLHMLRATRKGAEILIDFHVPVPPLAFENPWLQDGWTTSETDLGQTNTQYDVPDEGFTVRNTTRSTVLTVSSVALASDTQVLITLAAVPPSTETLVIRYADGAHKGHGTVRDSDTAKASDIWDNTIGGQTDADTNATLAGDPYPLRNWAVAQQITVEHLA
jgi:hypothetical protein